VDPVGGRGRALRVVLAPNSFKGSLSATQAAAAMAAGVRRVAPDADVAVVPIADGGDGSVDAFVSAGHSRVAIVTRGPTGEPGEAALAVKGRHAVVELASSCGMSRLPNGVTAPMASTTEGLGDALRAALDLGADRLLVCLGGSASTDGGTGMLSALGATLTDADGRVVPPGGAGLADIADLDLATLDPRMLTAQVTVAADVSSPLTGPAGAAAIFAPQKGAAPDEVAALEAGLRSWSRVLARVTDRDVAQIPGAGAAGGTAAALLAVFDAGITPGAAVIADLVGLDDRLESADLVVTGEGRLDRQSELGKGVAVVAARALAADVPVLAVCGRIDLTPSELEAAGFAGSSDCVSQTGSDVGAIEHAPSLLAEATATALAAWLRSR